MHSSMLPPNHLLVEPSLIPQASKQGSWEASTSHQSEDSSKLDKVIPLNPNALPQTLEPDDKDIGGIYDQRIKRENWAIDISERPYLRYLKSLSKGWPHITWLADFMEVSTTPIKWKVLGDKDIEERARKVKVAVIEYGNSYVKPTESHIDNTEDLQTFLESTAEPSYARLFVVEDLSRDVIEALGAKYDVDPQYFRSHIEDYLWNQETDAFTDLNGLPHQAKTRNYFNLRYMRARYFESEIVIREGKSELGHWNVLRSLEEDLSWKVRAIRKPKGPTVGLVRSKTALWIRKNKEEDHGILGILVVDPTLEAGYPLWEGPRNLLPCPSIHDTVIDQYGPHGTLFEDVCYYACNMSSEEMKAIEKDNRVLGLPIISLVTADWMRVIDYIITGLTRIEYRLEHPLYRPDTNLPALLDRLHPLRRLLPTYRTMISETLNAILDIEQEQNSNQSSIYIQRLNSDFKSLLARVEELQTRTPNIMSLVTTIIGVEQNQISMEENQQARETNENLARVTYVAVIFAPMAFISSFFSMEADLRNLKETFWIYLVVSIPVTLACLFVADGRNLIAKSHVPLPPSWRSLLRLKGNSGNGIVRKRSTMRDPEKGDN